MSQKSRIIKLSVLSILIVICIVLGVTYSFMQANIDSNSVTEVSLSSCAKITLEDGGDAILLENSYPVSRNKGMQTDPYTFTVTSDCESYVGFNMYLATLNTNTLSDSSVHYVITEHGSKEALVEGILSEAENALSEFNADEQNQLNIGINATFGTIYKLYNADISLQGSVTYDLYLWVDESVTNDTMNQVFKAGVAIKSYDREAGPTLADYIINNVYVEDGVNGLYYHDGNIKDRVCTFNDNNVYKYNFVLSTTSDDCKNIYYNPEIGYYDATLVEAVKWDISENRCETVSGNEIYWDINGNSNVSQEECNGKAIQSSSGLYYLVSYVGSGIIKDIVIDAEDNSYRYSGNYLLTKKAKKDGYRFITELFYPVVILNGESYKELSLDTVAFLVTEICSNVNPQNNFCIMLDESGVDNYMLKEFLVIEYNYEPIKIITDYFIDELSAMGAECGYESVYNIGMLSSFNDMIQYLLDNQYISYGINNYVCFGSNEEVCSEDNLYRIIGVFNGEVKLIKNTYANSDMLGIDGDYYSENKYYWNEKYQMDIYNEYKTYSIWKETALNKENLNLNYLSYLGNDWVDKISVHKWMAAGNDYRKLIEVTLKEAYNNEIYEKNNGNDYLYPEAKVGLMYLNDYGFAAGPGNWLKITKYYSNMQYDNWLYSENNEWFITPETNYTARGYYTYYGSITDGKLASGNIGPIYVRPTFYLNSDVRYVSGTGTEKDPYRIQ